MAKLSYAQHVARSHADHAAGVLGEAGSPGTDAGGGGFQNAIGSPGGAMLPVVALAARPPSHTAPLRPGMSRQAALSALSTPASVPNRERRAMYSQLRSLLSTRQGNEDAVRAAHVRSRARERIALATAESARPRPVPQYYGDSYADAAGGDGGGSSGLLADGEGAGEGAGEDEGERMRRRRREIEARAAQARETHERNEAERVRRRKEEAKRVREAAQAKREAAAREAERAQRDLEQRLFMEQEAKRDVGRGFRRHMRWRLLELGNAHRRRHRKRAVLTIERIWPTTPGCARARRLRTLCATALQAAWRGFAARRPQRRRYGAAALAAALRAERASKGAGSRRRTTRQGGTRGTRARAPTVMRATSDALATAAVVARARALFGSGSARAAAAAKAERRRRRRLQRRHQPGAERTHAPPAFDPAPGAGVGLGRAAAQVQRLVRGHAARLRAEPMREEQRRRARAARLDAAMRAELEY